MRPSFCREPKAAGAVQADGSLSAEGGKAAARILLPELFGTASAAGKSRFSSCEGDAESPGFCRRPVCLSSGELGVP